MVSAPATPLLGLIIQVTERSSLNCCCGLLPRPGLDLRRSGSPSTRKHSAWRLRGSEPRGSMGEKFAKIIYLVAISVATAGWLWLLAQGAMALLGL